MAIMEVIVLAAKFFLVEFPKLLEKYKLYRKDKGYKNKELAYEEALQDYRKAKLDNNQIDKLRALRKLGKGDKK